MTLRRRRASGTTLMEIMITLVVILIGMLGLFKVLSSSSQAGAQAQHVLQARARAQAVNESIRNAPDAALTCLVTTPATQWSNCEQACRSALGLPPPPANCDLNNPLPNGIPAQSPACVFTTLCNARLSVDTTRQQYAIVVDPNLPARSTLVTRGGLSGRLYESTVTVGWNDDGTARQNAPDHRVTMRSAVFR